jgi:hypothetical protein
MAFGCWDEAKGVGRAGCRSGRLDIVASGRGCEYNDWKRVLECIGEDLRFGSLASLRRLGRVLEWVFEVDCCLSLSWLFAVVLGVEAVLLEEGCGCPPSGVASVIAMS